MIKRTTDKKKLIEKIRAAIDTEQVIANCCLHVGELIKNGKVRNAFVAMAKEAASNKVLLAERLKIFGASTSPIAERCKFCKVSPESFSLLGALNLGVEVTGNAAAVYHDLEVLSESKEDKKFFADLTRAKKEHKIFLQKERSFAEERSDAAGMGCFGDYCIPQVIDKV